MVVDSAKVHKGANPRKCGASQSWRIGLPIQVA